jgi:hypothetical protein
MDTFKQKFELKYFEENRCTGNRNIMIAFDGDKTVDEFLEEVMGFMKAVGYQFNLEEHLEVVNDHVKEEDFNTEVDLWKGSEIWDEGV